MVLVGAGHAHLHVARHAGEFERVGAELTLLDPGTFWYSGLATGVLGGMYEPEDDQVDPRALVERHGGRFVRGRLAGLEGVPGRLRLESGEALEADIVSLNVGSEVDGGGIEETGRAWSVKPIANLARLRERLEERFGRKEATRIVVVGGGATGCEVAGNVDALARRRGARCEVRVISRGARILRGHPAGAARSLAGMLAARGIAVETGCAVRRIEEGGVLCGDGRRLEADEAVLATGLRPPRWLAGLGLPLGDDGGLLVDSRLRSTGNARVFGAGDCIAFEGRSLPRVGVFGVRAAPVLLANLLGVVTGRPLPEFRPQRRWLTILNLGRGTALAVREPFWWRGRASLWLKDRIDRRFLSLYR